MKRRAPAFWNKQALPIIVSVIASCQRWKRPDSRFTENAHTKPCTYDNLRKMIRKNEKKKYDVRPPTWHIRQEIPKVSLILECEVLALLLLLNELTCPGRCPVVNDCWEITSMFWMCCTGSANGSDKQPFVSKVDFSLPKQLPQSATPNEVIPHLSRRPFWNKKFVL